MDDIVKQAMLKWPNVPHCFGWLGLDARGNWYMRDDRAQAQGAFASGVPGAKGSLLQHAIGLAEVRLAVVHADLQQRLADIESGRPTKKGEASSMLALRARVSGPTLS